MVLTDRAKSSIARALWRRLGAAMLWCASAQLLAQAVPAAGDDELARSIVEKADHVRFPVEPFEASVTISSTDANGPAEVRRYQVLAKGNENTLVMVTEPASERGQILLLKGHDLWIFLPAVSQPVRLSLAQRLTGQVANGDLARANFAGDYTAKLLRTEKIDNESLYVLELTAVDRSVTYHRVLYWVRQANYRPYTAEFYSLSDHLLKTCLYQNYKPLAGRERPTRLVMQNALLKDQESVLEYSAMRLRDLPDRMFTKDYLKRLE
jgi:outer membrane lipoprotein-sorting protein